MSKLNCWPGCLAIVKAGIHAGELYTVRAWMGRYEFRGGSRANDVWICAAEQPVTIRGKKGEKQEFRAGDDILIQDSRLRPITPPPGTITEDEVIELYSPRTTSPEEAC
jgi:hypothetical protein